MGINWGRMGNVFWKYWGIFRDPNFPLCNTNALIMIALKEELCLMVLGQTFNFTFIANSIWTFSMPSNESERYLKRHQKRLMKVAKGNHVLKSNYRMSKEL